MSGGKRYWCQTSDGSPGFTTSFLESNRRVAFRKVREIVANGYRDSHEGSVTDIYTDRVVGRWKNQKGRAVSLNP